MEVPGFPLFFSAFSAIVVVVVATTAVVVFRRPSDNYPEGRRMTSHSLDYWVILFSE